MTTQLDRPDSQRVRALASAGVLAGLCFMVYGLALAMGLLNTDPLAIPAGQGGQLTDTAATDQIGVDVKSSFGVVAVEYVKALEGLSSRSLAGATHGVPGLIDTKHVQVQTALSVTNRSDAPLNFSVGQVTLRVTRGGETTTVDPVTADIPDTRVLPDAAIEGHVDFVIPRQPARLTLVFKDPGRTVPILIDLGRPAFPDPVAGHDHAH